MPKGIYKRTKFKEKKRVKLICQICKKEFKVFPYRKNAKYCSKKCYGKSLEGKSAWNKGMKGIHLSPKSEFKKGYKQLQKTIKKRVKSRKGYKHSEKTKEKMKQSVHRKEKSWNWKGGCSKNKREYNKKWRQENYSKMKKCIKKWRKENYNKILYLNLRRRKNKLNAEGSHTFKEWELLKKECSYFCLRCKKQEPEIILTEDHIAPLSKGGSDYIKNIQPLCRSCNCKKHTKIIKYER